jgi:hypothetical protein
VKCTPSLGTSITDGTSHTVFVLVALLTFGRLVRSVPLSIRQLAQSPISTSSDVWATVVANVAPLMALVGERNAKEYMRVASSRNQLWLMAAAPVGILSIMVSAIRLCGPRLLRRLVGRESDRRSEALVELTPLSVEPATSAYTPNAVEIEPLYNRDRVAFVCAHVQKASEIYEALAAFKKLMLARNGKSGADRDFEIVLGLAGSTLTLAETAQLITTVITEDKTIDSALATRIALTSLSFRTTGISPSQTAQREKTLRGLLPQIRQALIGAVLCLFMCGIQIAGYYGSGSFHGTGSLETLVMGLCGYGGIVVFTMGLLIMIKQEVLVEPQELPDIFDTAIWTFSDARHAEHRAITIPPHTTLAIASPTTFNRPQKIRRHCITAVLCVGLVGSYVTFYLGIRVAEWWVAFGSVAIIWLAAGYRAVAIQHILVANESDLGEHWLGLFRDTLYDSLLETVQTLEARKAYSRPPDDSPVIDQSRGIGQDMEHKCPINTDDGGCILLSAKPIRQSLKNWSGCEDVMKVSLEMAKRACRNNVCNLSYASLESPKFSSVPGGKFTSWFGIFRFRLMIYVPGMTWKARRSIDYVLTKGEFDLPNLFRDMFKMLHMCADFEGDVETHTVTEAQIVQLSDSLCGPVSIPEAATISSHMTLSDLLCLLRDLNPPGKSGPKAYTLEQAVLLPIIQLAVMYEDSREETVSCIQTYQNKHIDKLVLSGGGKWLGTLEAVFEQEGIWRSFMRPKESVIERRRGGRDATSGLYVKGIGNASEEQWEHWERVGPSNANVLEWR